MGEESWVGTMNEESWVGEEGWVGDYVGGLMGRIVGDLARS